MKEKLKREAERKRRAEERELEKKRKAEQREAEKKRKAELRQKLGAEREKRTRSVKQQASVNENGIQSAKISSNECAACLGAYEDDIIDGVLRKEWIQCTNSYAGGKWMHCSCLSTDESGEWAVYVSYLSNHIFLTLMTHMQGVYFILIVTVYLLRLSLLC